MNRIPELITRNSDLQDFVREAASAPWFGLDTEFVRDRHYYPRFGLLQVATSERIVLIDPQALEKSPALPTLLFATPGIKIFHAAYQDLELIAHHYGRVPTPLFDTQAATEHLGHQAQIGYATLVRDRLEAITVDSLGRYDWLKRPLSRTAIRYAADDVRYLGILYSMLSRDLEDSGLTRAFKTVMEARTDVARYLPNPDEAWRRIRAARRLSGAAQERLRRLAAWRERQAMAEDRPRQWLVRDHILMLLARLAPTSLDGLDSIRGLPPAIRHRYGRVLVELLTPITDATPAIP